MAGAVGFTMAAGGVGQAVMPSLVGVLAATVAVGRWGWRAAVPARRRRLELQAA
jgi:hypothetical protein